MIYVMSGTGKAFAVISVTYPEGSTCTCSDGTKTLKLKDTSGQGFFLIPYAGTWTVTATDGIHTVNRTVSITTEGQEETVSISYELTLILNGVVTDENEWQKIGTITTKISGNYLVLGSGAGPGYGSFTSRYVTKNTYDLTGYSALTLSSGSAYIGETQTTSAASGSTIDLTGITGEYYIGFALGGWYGTSGELHSSSMNVGTLTLIP